MRHGVLEIKMKNYLLRSYISYNTAHWQRLHWPYYTIVNVKYSKRVLSCVLRFTMAKKPVLLRRVIQHWLSFH